MDPLIYYLEWDTILTIYYHRTALGAATEAPSEGAILEVRIGFMCCNLIIHKSLIK